MPPFLRYLILLCVIVPCSSSAQHPAMDDFMQLYRHFTATARFDHDYPREKVYLHLDNHAYMEGETLWFKAYVARSSTLLPSELSKVLYVELLNADGQLIERQLLRIDSLGQAHGQFELKLPVKFGFYEIRAFTREMLNWGDEACYSRVIPVFEAKEGNELNIEMADMHDSRRINTAEVQPSQQSAGFLEFYPEGGNRVKGIPQKWAYRQTTENGLPGGDTLEIYTSDGILYSTSVPLHEGMGCFVLSEDFPEGGYVKMNSLQFELPKTSAAVHGLRVEQAVGGFRVLLSSTEDANQLMGLMALCRDKVCYFDTLTLSRGTLEYFIPADKLHGGVNRIELFDRNGHSKASRMVWNDVANRRLQLHVRQNALRYQAFEPVALELLLTDKEQQPVSTTFSLAVRDNGGDLPTNADVGLYVDWLLSSELKGYIHQPAFYFEDTDAFRREALDLLLMVQGWRANSFETLCGQASFQLIHPIEEGITLDGVVYYDNNRKKPYPDLDLNVQMYSFSGGALNGAAKTDSVGRFVFQSNVDFEGDYIAQFTTKNDKGKKKWSRVAINRWFAPRNRWFSPREMALQPPRHLEAEVSDTLVEVFEWEDTIPRIINTSLSEATVVGRNKYRGFTGNRYTFNGGEEGGMRQSEYFYNIALETERAKDMGQSPGYIYDFMAWLDGRNEYDATGEMAAAPEHYVQHEATASYGNSEAGQVDKDMANSFAAGTFDNDFDYDSEGVSEVYFRNALTRVFLNNSKLHFSMYDQPMLAEEIKTVVVMRNGARSRHLVGEVDAKYKYIMVLYEWPDYYRYRSQKGVEKRRIQGYAPAKKFYSPSYKGLDLPTEQDRRRTLYWNPQVRTNAAGQASVVFFNNSRDGVVLRMSAKGVTQDGLILDEER